MNELEEITVTRENDEVIAHVFIENGEVQAIVENGFKVSVNGIGLEREEAQWLK